MIDMADERKVEEDIETCHRLVEAIGHICNASISVNIFGYVVGTERFKNMAPARIELICQVGIGRNVVENVRIGALEVLDVQRAFEKNEELGQNVQDKIIARRILEVLKTSDIWAKDIWTGKEWLVFKKGTSVEEALVENDLLAAKV